MCQDIIVEEVGKYKDASKSKIKMMIFIYRCLRFLNGDSFYFIFSLSTILVPLFIFNFNFIVIFLGMVLHYIVFMIFVKNRIDKYFKTKEDNQEVDEIIEKLKSYLKNKNPNV